MPEVCANHSGGSEGGEVVRFLGETAFKMTLKRCVRATVLKAGSLYSQGSQDLPRDCKAIYTIMQRLYLPLLLC